MSSDWTVLSEVEPTQVMLVEAMVEAAPHLLVREVSDNAVLELFDDAGTVLVAVELPRLIQLPTEVDRLLRGAPVTVPDGSAGVPAYFSPDTSAETRARPLWWQDLHVVNGEHDGAALADVLTHALARRCAGVVVAPAAAPAPSTTGGTP